MSEEEKKLSDLLKYYDSFDADTKFIGHEICSRIRQLLAQPVPVKPVDLPEIAIKEPVNFLLSNALRLLSIEQMEVLRDSLSERLPRVKPVQDEKTMAKIIGDAFEAGADFGMDSYSSTYHDEDRNTDYLTKDQYIKQVLASLPPAPVKAVEDKPKKVRVPQADDVSCMGFLNDPYPTALPDEKTMDLNVFIVSKQLITENGAVVAIMNALRLADPECYIGITPVIQKPETQNQAVEGETITNNSKNKSSE